jgi:hypothetical protein
MLPRLQGGGASAPFELSVFHSREQFIAEGLRIGNYPTPWQIRQQEYVLTTSALGVAWGCWGEQRAPVHGVDRQEICPEASAVVSSPVQLKLTHIRNCACMNIHINANIFWQVDFPRQGISPLN